MPLYSDLYHNYIGNTPVIPAPIVSSLPSSTFLPPSYVGVSRSFGTPITATRTPSFSRGYVPKLTPITETPLTGSRVTALTRINSPKYIPSHASPTYQKPRRVINTADIDVSASRYAIRDHTPIRDRYPSSSPSSSVSSDTGNNSPLSVANVSAREQELIERNEQRKARSAINRNRAVVRLNTIRARSKSRGSRGSTERKSPRRTDSPDKSFEDESPQTSRPTSWRDQFRGELSLQPKKVEPIKSPGELLLEKHLIRDDEVTPIVIDEATYKSPVMKRRATVRRKSGVKIPSFHEICSDINSDKLDDDLNAGELRRRASQIIEDEIAQFQEELHKANGVMNDQLEERLKTALEQQITDSGVELAEKKKVKKVRRVRSKPLPKLDTDESNGVHDPEESGGVKVTADSPTIETTPAIAPTIKAEVESIEECAVFKLPKKKKKVASGESLSSPESGEKPVKKVVKKPVASKMTESVVKTVAVSAESKSVENLSVSKPLVLGELAQRRKAQELQKKIDTLSKMCGKKVPTESVDSAAHKEKTESKKTEADNTTEATAKIKQFQELDGKKSERPEKIEDATKKEIEVSSPPTELSGTALTSIKSTENDVKITRKAASEEEANQVLKPPIKSIAENQLSRPPGEPATSKLQTKSLGKLKEPRKDQEVPLTLNQSSENVVQPDEKTDSNAKTVKSEEIKPQNLSIGAPTIQKETELTEEKTNKEIPCALKEESLPNMAEKKVLPSLKPKPILKSTTTEGVKEAVESKANGDGSELIAAQKSAPSAKLQADELKQKTKPGLKTELKTAKPQEIAQPEKKIELTRPTEKMSDVADGPKEKVPSSEFPDKVAKSSEPEPEKLSKDLQLPPEPKKSEKPDLPSPPQKPTIQVKPVDTPTVKSEPAKPELPKPHVPEPPKPPPKPAEPSVKPKPILKPALRKKPVELTKVPSQDEVDFWGNIGTRETISFARRKQNLERRNQMILLKFSETEEDSESAPITSPTAKTFATKLMSSPPAAENAAASMPKWPKPAGDEETVPAEVTSYAGLIVNKPAKMELQKPKEISDEGLPKKAFEVSLVKLEQQAPASPTQKQLPPPEAVDKTKPAPLKSILKIDESPKPARDTSPTMKDGLDTELPTSPKTKKPVPKMTELKQPATVDTVSKEPTKPTLDNGPTKTPATNDQSPKPTRNVFSLKKVQKTEAIPEKAAPTPENLPTAQPPETELSLLKTPVQTGLLKPSEIAAKRLLNQKLSPKEMIKAVAPTIAAAAEKKLARTLPPELPKTALKQEKAPADKPEALKPTTNEPEKTSEGKQETVQKTVIEPPKASIEPATAAKPLETTAPSGEKKTKIVIKKVIRIVKPKSAAPVDAAAKAEADRLEAERRKAQENVEKMKAKVNQITLNMGVKLEVEIKDCAKCQKATLSGELPASKTNGKKKPTTAAADKAAVAQKADDGGKLTKNKFGVITNLSNLSAAKAGDRSVGDQVSTGAEQPKKTNNKQLAVAKPVSKARYSSSSSEADEGSGSETSFSGVEDDWSSEEEEMANDKPEKKKFDPQKRVKLNFEQMRKCYSKEEKSPIVLVARPRPLWKVKRHGHRHNRKADLTSSSSASEDESGSTTDQTSSEATSTVDASSDVNTDSSVNSSRGNNKKKHVKSTSKTSDLGSDIYDNPMVIPLHTEPPSSSSKCPPAKDENNNERSQSQQAQNEEDDENNKNAGNHEIRSTSTSSHDSGFYGGGTAPISPKKAMETSYTYAQFQKTGKLTAPATVIPRFRKYNVDDFHFLTVLGKGSFGKVFLAELRNTEYYYAVKCLKKDVVLEDDDVDCTLIERKVLALGTKHPFLCHLFCTFQTDSHLFFVMEYLNGGDLMFHIQQSGRFTEARARFYAAEIVSGLKFLHRKGIVYRDLKLDNVLLDYDGHVRIADFGMCKLEIYLDRLADSFCGTPDYMAPEIIKGQKYNQAVDWWSFGVLVYEMLVGQSPFSGCDEDELFWSICNEIPWFPHFLSKEALKLLKSLLEKDATIRLGCLNTMDEESDIKYHPFFESIDWKTLERRGLEPPFKPQVRHPLDTQYFDKQFTRERARLTPIDRNILASMNQAQFEGFTYTNPNNTLTTTEVTYHPIRCRIQSRPSRFYY
ncbi:titin-like [Sabethes cyaneus]|uniref:titin-like n=1 Tax=Sabethes cyaneus TaxID=53552 RepID=UPI00237DF477|nr:titin-like [Sabethes cyaneus]